jgi:hypothetical protein
MGEVVSGGQSALADHSARIPRSVATDDERQGSGRSRPEPAGLGGELDLDGRLRIWDGDGDGSRIVDMGAYEFAAPIPADLNGDCEVGLADLAHLLSHYGTVCDPAPCAYPDGDLNGDGTIDLADLSILLSSFGATCP